MKAASRVTCSACGASSLVMCEPTAETVPCPRCLADVERSRLEVAMGWKRRVERAAAMAEIMSRHPQADRHPGKLTRGNA